MHRSGIRHIGCSRITNARSTVLRGSGVLAAIAVMGVVALSLVAASPAAATLRVIKCSANGSCKTYCREQLADGASVDYADGTEITVNLTDGTSRKFTCKNGKWVASLTVRGQIGFNIGVGEFNGTIVSVTCPPDVLFCPQLETRIGPPGLIGGSRG